MVLLTAALLTSSIATVLGAGAAGGAALAAAAGTGATSPASLRAEGNQGAGPGQRYFVDSLFRRDLSATPGALSPAPGSGDSDASMSEATRIFAAATSAGSLPADDSRYLGQAVAQRTAMPQADAEKRVADTFSRMQEKAKQAADSAREAADKARKASAYSALWLFVSLLIGAFCASLAATYGGRRRDQF
jgi:hypothetical protein